jgi:hypothetical protein
MRGEILDIDTGRFAATYFCYYHHHHTRPIETADLGGLWTVDRGPIENVGRGRQPRLAASSQFHSSEVLSHCFLGLGSEARLFRLSRL